MISLIDRCLELPYRERINLCAAIQDSILQERRDRVNHHSNRGQFLLDMMGQILGERIPVHSRESRYVWARTMVAYQLLQEGFSSTETGRMIKKDHSTIYAMKGKMDAALKYQNAYRDIINIWDQFQERLKDEIHKGTTQDLVCLGG